MCAIGTLSSICIRWDASMRPCGKRSALYRRASRPGWKGGNDQPIPRRAARIRIERDGLLQTLAAEQERLTCEPPLIVKIAEVRLVSCRLGCRRRLAAGSGANFSLSSEGAFQTSPIPPVPSDAINLVRAEFWTCSQRHAGIQFILLARVLKSSDSSGNRPVAPS